MLDGVRNTVIGAVPRAVWATFDDADLGADFDLHGRNPQFLVDITSDGVVFQPPGKFRMIDDKIVPTAVGWVDFSSFIERPCFFEGHDRL